MLLVKGLWWGWFWNGALRISIAFLRAGVAAWDRLGSITKCEKEECKMVGILSKRASFQMDYQLSWQNWTINFGPLPDWLLMMAAHDGLDFLMKRGDRFEYYLWGREVLQMDHWGPSAGQIVPCWQDGLGSLNKKEKEECKMAGIMCRGVFFLSFSLSDG